MDWMTRMVGPKWSGWIVGMEVGYVALGKEY